MVSLFFLLLLMLDGGESFDVSFNADVIYEQVRKYHDYMKYKWAKSVYHSLKRKKVPKTKICKLWILQKVLLCKWILNSEHFRRSFEIPINTAKTRYKCHKMDVVPRGDYNVRKLPMFRCPRVKPDVERDLNTQTHSRLISYFLSGTAAKNSVLVFGTTLIEGTVAPKALVTGLEMESLNEVDYHKEATEFTQTEFNEMFHSTESPDALIGKNSEIELTEDSGTKVAGVVV